MHVILCALFLGALSASQAVVNDHLHNESKKLRLLAFGDSITEGYSKGGTLKHPYSIELQRQLDFHKYNAEVGVGCTGTQLAGLHDQ